MNRRAVWAIARKDIRSVTANVQVWLPMLILPIIFSVILPGAALLGTAMADLSRITSNPGNMDLIRRMTAGPLAPALQGLPDLRQQLAYLMANYMFAPLFLIIPLMAASVVAANSLVGEKERGTLESLLFAPVDIPSLFTGKVLASLIPAVSLSLISFVLYGVTVNLTGWPLFGRLIFPTPNWWWLVLWVSPMISLTAILFNVMISARVADFQAANQLGALIILPVAVLFVGQITGAMLMGGLLLFMVGGVLALINGVMLRVIVFHFDRNRLFESQVK